MPKYDLREERQSKKKRNIAEIQNITPTFTYKGFLNEIEKFT